MTHTVEKIGRKAGNENRRSCDAFQLLAKGLKLFNYTSNKIGAILVVDDDIDALRKNLLRPKYNSSTLIIKVSPLDIDGALNLNHDYLTAQKDLHLALAERVLEYIQRVRRRHVTITSVDDTGKQIMH